MSEEHAGSRQGVQEPDSRRRALLRGVLAGGPAILTLYGGRAWAVSSCGQEVRRIAANEGLDVNDEANLDRVNQLLNDVQKAPLADDDPNTAGLQNSCLVSFNG